MSEDKKPSFGGSGGSTSNRAKEIAALWKKTDKNGNEFFSVKVKLDGKEVNLNFFKNRAKEEGSNQPDFKAYEG